MLRDSAAYPQMVDPWRLSLHSLEPIRLTLPLARGRSSHSEQSTRLEQLVLSLLQFTFQLTIEFDDDAVCEGCGRLTSSRVVTSNAEDGARGSRDDEDEEEGRACGFSSLDFNRRLDDIFLNWSRLAARDR